MHVNIVIIVPRNRVTTKIVIGMIIVAILANSITDNTSN